MAARLELDFQRRPGALNPTAIALLLAGAVCLAAVVQSHLALSGQLEVLEHRVDAAQQVLRRQTPAAPRAGDAAARIEQSHQAQEVLALLALPWQDALAQLGEVNRSDIALLTVEPDMQKGVIRLAGDARSYAAVLEYMKLLEQRPGLGEVLLQSHQVDAQKPGQPTRFTITARWRTPT